MTKKVIRSSGDGRTPVVVVRGAPFVIVRFIGLYNLDIAITPSCYAHKTLAPVQKLIQVFPWEQGVVPIG